MKTKRFATTEIVNYRKSNCTKAIYFDTLDEAIAHVKNQKELHPKSKKFNPYIVDIEINPRVRINGLYPNL